MDRLSYPRGTDKNHVMPNLTSLKEETACGRGRVYHNRQYSVIDTSIRHVRITQLYMSVLAFPGSTACLRGLWLFKWSIRGESSITNVYWPFRLTSRQLSPTLVTSCQGQTSVDAVNGRWRKTHLIQSPRWLRGFFGEQSALPSQAEWSGKTIMIKWRVWIHI